jgi:hypothetical protein
VPQSIKTSITCYTLAVIFGFIGMFVSGAIKNFNLANSILIFSMILLAFVFLYFISNRKIWARNAFVIFIGLDIFYRFWLINLFSSNHAHLAIVVGIQCIFQAASVALLLTKNSRVWVENKHA